MSGVLPSTRALGSPIRRQETLPTNARPEQRAAFRRRQEQEIDAITANMRAQREAMLAKLGYPPRSGR